MGEEGEKGLRDLCEKSCAVHSVLKRGGNRDKELARMGYEKPSTKLTFYKAFFSSQWKFLIHTILQCMSAKRTSWNEFSSLMASVVICLSSGKKFNFSKYIFDSLVRNVDSLSKFYMYPRFLQLMIRKQVGDLSTHTTKYTSPALTQKVFTNMRRVGKGFSEVETPLFEGMLVAREVEEGDADEIVANVNADDTTEGDVSAANDEVPTANEEPSIPSPIPPTPPPQPSQDIPSTSQVGTGQRIETSDETVMEDVSSQGRMIVDMDVDADVVLEEAKEVADDAKADQDAEEETEPTELQEVVDVVTTTKFITEVVTTASTTISVAEVPVPAAITAAVLKLTATPSRRRKGVVIRDPEEPTTTTSIIIHTEAKSKDKGKGILVEEPKPLKKQAQIEQDEQYAKELEAGLNKNIDWDEVIDHVKKKAKEDPATKEHIDEEESKALKRINETPAEKAAKRQKLDEEVEELKRHLQIVPNEEDDVYTEATSLARKVPVVDYEIINQNNKPYYKIIRADDTRQLYLSFLSLLRNFDREDLEALWSLVKERFAITKPKNFSDDFLLITLGAIKSQELEAVGIIWCADNCIYNNTADFFSREEVSIYKVLSGSDAKCWLKQQVHELEIELPGDLKEIPSKLEEFTKTIISLTSQVTELKILQWELPAEFVSLHVQFASVQAKLKTLDALLGLLLNVTKSLNRFAQVLDSISSKVRDQSVPSAGQADRSSQTEGDHMKKDKGKKAMSSKDVKEVSTESDSNVETTHVPGSMVESSKKKELKKFNFVTKNGEHVHLIEELISAQKKIEEEAKAKAARREGEIRKEVLIDLLNLEVGPITLKVYREDDTIKIIPEFKASDLLLGKWREVITACPNKKGKGWTSIYKYIQERIDYLRTTEAELGIDLDKPLSERDPLDKLNDLENKKRKHADDIHDFFRANKRLKSPVQYKYHPAGTMLNEPILDFTKVQCLMIMPGPSVLFCLLKLVLRRLGSIFTSVYAAVQNLKNDS
uniref:Glutamic acid-rich protein-like n=1 Tax=Tanacetum cinerariifolium TaxID=118510 RepID=A0A6L2L2I3_TANCI|nr:hypothetical protein [Tanacetum cinerariifolium]